MKILIVHGYFLSGTGSNLFVNKLANELSKKHTVHVMCQEEKSFLENKEIKILKPNIGKKLPVYVYDKYVGYDAFEMKNANYLDLEEYILKNSDQLKFWINKYKYDLIISNHLVLQPQYVNKAIIEGGFSKIRHFNVVHGSDLHFAIKESSIIYDYGVRALKDTDKIICVSESSANELKEIYLGENFDFSNKIVTLFSAADTKIFTPLISKRKKDVIHSLKNKFIDNNKFNSQIRPKILDDLTMPTFSPTKLHDSFELKLTEEEAYSKIIKELNEDIYVITFVGKYLETKGIFQLILALPLLEIDDFMFLAVGFGNFRVELEYLIQIFKSKDIEKFKLILVNPELLNIKLYFSKDNLMELYKYLDSNNIWHKYMENAQKIYTKIIFTGYLDSTGVSEILKISDQFIAPSVYSEAFGMVAIEAIASGAKASLSYQTGFKDIIDFLKTKEDFIFDLEIAYDSMIIANIAKVINKNYTIKQTLESKIAYHNLIKNNFSWEALADEILKIK